MLKSFRLSTETQDRITIMNVEALLPLKLNSERVINKNLRSLGGKPLFNYILETLCKCEHIERVTIFSSTEDFKSHTKINSEKIDFRLRPKYLDFDSASISDVISEFCSVSDAKLITLAHATSPFLTVDTIEECIESVMSEEFDSAMATISLNKFVWNESEPINYDLTKPVPRTQDLPNLTVEQSGLYVFGRTEFLKTGRRIGFRPKMVAVDELEGFDIDTETDLLIAESLLKIQDPYANNV